MSDTTQVAARTDKQDWTTWRKLLAGEKTPIHDGDPQAGFYKIQAPDKSWLPVTYWFLDGKLRCRISGKDVDEQIAREKWSFALKNAIPYETYKLVIEGGAWPNENAAVAGHNKAPVDDTLEAINERIEDLAREAEKMIVIGGATSAAIADQASDLANTFGELEKKADRLREDEKAPHLDAGRAVDGKWRTVINRANDLKARLKRYVVTPFLTQQEVEKQKVQAAAVAKGVAPDAVPEVRTTAGSSKRSTGLRTVKSAQIDDYAKLLDHLKEHPAIKEAVQTIANASAKAGVPLPGMTIKSEKVAA